MGKSAIFIQKISSYTTIIAFFVCIVVLVIYTFITRESIVPLNILYEKHQRMKVFLPQHNTTLYIKYSQAIGGKNYVKFLNSLAHLKKDEEEYKIRTKLVLANSKNFNNLNLKPKFIFPDTLIAQHNSEILVSGFSFFKNNLLFLDDMVIKKHNLLNLNSGGGKKVKDEIYLTNLKVSGLKYKLLSYDKAIYNKKYIKSSNVFLSLNWGYQKINGFAKKMLFQLITKNQFLCEITKFTLSSKDGQLYSNMAYIEQRKNNLHLYLINGFKLRYYDFNISSFYPAILSVLPTYIKIFIPEKNVIVSNNLTIKGENITIKKHKNNLSVISKKLLKINIGEGLFLSNRIMFHHDENKYILIGNVFGELTQFPQNLELKAENLTIKEGKTLIKLYSKMPITFKTKGEIIKATKITYNKKQKRVTFLSDKFFVSVKKLLTPKLRIFTEKLSIQKDNSILLSNKFSIVFLEKLLFGSFSGVGVVSISERKINMIGTVYTTITASKPLSYITQRQYITFDNKKTSGFSRNNIFLYRGSKFFADTLNVAKSKAKVCNRYGIKINYLYKTRISTKCIIFYFDKEKLVFPQGKIEK